MIRVRTTSRPPRGFTLVEMLTVIVIIGILASLITAAAISARNRVRIGAVKAEIGQLEMAVERYKTEYGEYPPDFSDQQAVERHLQKRFPRYMPDTSQGRTTRMQELAYDLLQNYGLDLTKFTPACALAFWLGGLPEENAGDWRSQGFHSDPSDPFKTGGPRTEVLFDFDADRIRTDNGALRYYPKGIEVPYVYFRSRKQEITMADGRSVFRSEYGSVDNAAGKFTPLYYAHDGDTQNVAAPYLDADVELPPSTADIAQVLTAATTQGTRVAQIAALDRVRKWRNEDSFQIICAGFDGQFGEAEGTTSGIPDPAKLIRYTRVGINFRPDLADHDNITNFSEGTLGDEL